jgi:hypothetical protein
LRIELDAPKPRENPTSYDFRCECDLVGNTTATTIQAYGQGDSKTTLFKYGPDDRSGAPQITVQANRIVIEIDSVLAISLQENRYKTYAVDYKIKHVEYPQK